MQERSSTGRHSPRQAGRTRTSETSVRDTPGARQPSGGNPPAGKPGPRGTLSSQVIIDAALRLLDDNGPEAMSMRGIATELGVAPNALYTYFPDKAAVLRAVVDRLIGAHAVAALGANDQPWRERIHELALQLRSGLLSHPGAAGLILGAPMDGPQALALGEQLLDVLTEAGLEPDDAARACYLIVVYLLGFVALEAAELDPTQPAPPEHERVTARQAGFNAIPAATYPHTAASASVMARYITTEQFTWGLDRIMNGLTDPDRTLDRTPTDPSNSTTTQATS